MLEGAWYNMCMLASYYFTSGQYTQPSAKQVANGVLWLWSSDAPCRAPCNERCSKVLRCRHRCPGLCGEACPAEACVHPDCLRQLAAQKRDQVRRTQKALVWRIFNES